MNWNDLLNALALVLIIEGILPFAAPQKYKQNLDMVGKMTESQLRTMGFVIIMGGLALLLFH